MSVLPLYIEIERPRPVFEPRLNHCDLLSGLVLPAILAAQRRRCQELQNSSHNHIKPTHNTGSLAEANGNESRATPQNGVSVEQGLSQELKEGTNARLMRSDADKFEVSLDVRHFSQEELSVKTADGCILVEGKHEEKRDEHGYISRQFVRRYALPEGCNPDTVQSRLSLDGVLTVTAPKKQPALTGERAVPIMHTDIPSTSQQQQEDAQQ